MDKKADVAMNLIVAAAIALVVLIVILAIFTGRLQLFGGGVKKTETSARGTLCVDPLDEVNEFTCTSEDLTKVEGQNWKRKSLIPGTTWADCQYECYYRAKSRA